MGLIGAGLGAVGAVFGGIKASQAMKQLSRNINKQMQQNQDWYDRRYNEDATQRADAQRILAKTEESIKQRNKAATGRAAVMGATDESVAAEKEANSQALADATGQIAANADASKDAIENQYMSRKADLNNQLNEIEKGKAQAISQAVQGVTSAAGQMNFGGIL